MQADERFGGESRDTRPAFWGSFVSVAEQIEGQETSLARKAQAAIEREGSWARMDEQVIQPLPSCAFDQPPDQKASQAAVPMFLRDIDALDMSRQPFPDLRAWDPLNDGEPSHSDNETTHLNEIRNMGVLVFGDPALKLRSEPIWVSLLGPLHGPPDPP